MNLKILQLEHAKEIKSNDIQDKLKKWSNFSPKKIEKKNI